MEQPDVPAALDGRPRERPASRLAEDTTYYLAHLTLFVQRPARHGRLARQAVRLPVENARRATNFFQIPPDRVVEIGIQLEI